MQKKSHLNIYIGEYERIIERKTYFLRYIYRLSNQIPLKFTQTVIRRVLAKNVKNITRYKGQELVEKPRTKVMTHVEKEYNIFEYSIVVFLIS